MNISVFKTRGRSNDLQNDEKLAIEVQKYKCLYDKTNLVL